MFKTITARFPGTCKRCNEAIAPGDRIRFGGRGRTYHLAAECPTGDNRRPALDLEDAPGDFYGADNPEPEPAPMTFTTIAGAKVTTRPATAADFYAADDIATSDPTFRPSTPVFVPTTAHTIDF